MYLSCVKHSTLRDDGAAHAAQPRGQCLVKQQQGWEARYLVLESGRVLWYSDEMKICPEGLHRVADKCTVTGEAMPETGEQLIIVKIDDSNAVIQIAVDRQDLEMWRIALDAHSDIASKSNLDDLRRSFEEDVEEEADDVVPDEGSAGNELDEVVEEEGSEVVEEEGSEVVDEEGSEVVEEEGEESEVFEITIGDKSYYTNDEINGSIYAVDANEEVGDEVGVFVNRKPTFKK